MPTSLIHLKVLLPFQVFAEKTDVSRIIAETREGSFGLLPHRLDCVAALVPGILIYQTQSAGEVFVAVDQGVLVKIGMDVLVSVRRATGGKDLSQLHAVVEKEFLTLDETEQSVRQATAKLETGFLRRFANLQHDLRTEQSLEKRINVRRRNRREGDAKDQGAQIHARRLAGPGHDGSGRLVGGRADSARCGAWYLAGQTLSGQTRLDTGVIGGRVGTWLFECVVLGGQRGKSNAGRTGG